MKYKVSIKHKGKIVKCPKIKVKMQVKWDLLILKMEWDPKVLVFQGEARSELQKIRDPRPLKIIHYMQLWAMVKLDQLNKKWYVILTI